MQNKVTVIVNNLTKQ